jgi:MiaB-like tRNA modifying enzyme
MGLLNGSAAAEIADLFSQNSFSGHDGLQDSPGQCPSQIAIADPPDLCAVVNIAEGCNGGCSFCIVRKARGRLVSRSPEEIVEEVRRIAGEGIAEVQLAAMDSAAYGQDIGTSLPELLEEVASVPGNFMVRVGMMNPDSLRPILCELMASYESPRIYKLLHIPVQSGSDRTLLSMGRSYSAADFLEMVRVFRSSFPDLSVITDAIAGFPGEEDADFGQTLDLIRSLQPDKVNVTRFSRRPGTAAARLYDMPDRIKKDRSRELTRLWMEIAGRRNRRYVGEVVEALVTERGRGGSMKARAANYAGIVVVGAPPMGCLYRIRITEANPFYLKGRLEL